MTDKPDTAPLREQLVREAEAAEAEWDREDAVPPVVRARAQASDPSQVYSVRIPVQQIERLRRLAEVRGVKPTVLMREWVLERLAAEDPAAQAPEDRLVEFLDERQLLAQPMRSRPAAAARSATDPVVDGFEVGHAVRLGTTRRFTSSVGSPDVSNVTSSSDRRQPRPRRVGGKRP